MFKFLKALFFPTKEESRPVNKTTTHYERDVQMKKEETKACDICNCEEE